MSGGSEMESRTIPGTMAWIDMEYQEAMSKGAVIISDQRDPRREGEIRHLVETASAQSVPDQLHEAAYRTGVTWLHLLLHAQLEAQGLELPKMPQGAAQQVVPNRLQPVGQDELGQTNSYSAAIEHVALAHQEADSDIVGVLGWACDVYANIAMADNVGFRERGSMVASMASGFIDAYKLNRIAGLAQLAGTIAQVAVRRRIEIE